MGRSGGFKFVLGGFAVGYDDFEGVVPVSWVDGFFVTPEVDAFVGLKFSVAVDVAGIIQRSFAVIVRNYFAGARANHGFVHSVGCTVSRILVGIHKDDMVRK